MENATTTLTYPSSYLLLPTIFFFLYSSTGIFAFYFLLKVIFRNSECLPEDVKFLIVNLTCCFGIRELYMVYKSVFELLIYHYGFETLAVSFTYCAIEQSFYMATGLCRNATFLIISLNRLWKTVSKPSAFRHSGSERSAWFMALIFISCTWIPSYFLYSMIVIASSWTLNTSLRIKFCYLTSIFESRLSNVQNYVMLFMQFATTAVYVLVYVLNKSKLRKFAVPVMEKSLNGRYVQWANVKVSRWLMPLTLFSALLSAATISSAILIRTLVKLSQIQVISMSMILIMIYAADATLYPFMCIWYSPYLLQVVQQQHPSLYNIFARVFRCVNADIHATTKIKLNKINNLSCKPTKVSDSKTKIGPTIVVTSINVANSSQKKLLVEGKRKIVDHHLSPDLQVEMLHQLWTKA